MTIPDLLADLKEKLGQATPGRLEATLNVPSGAREFQWDFDHETLIALIAERIRKGGSRLYCITTGGDDFLVVADTGNGPTSEANALWLAAIHNAAPTLIAEVERLRERETKLGAQVLTLQSAWEACDEERVEAIFANDELQAWANLADKERKQFAQERDEMQAENDRLRAQVEPMTQAVGLLTTLHPTMQIDTEHPLEMAQQIERYVRTQVEAGEKLREALVKAKNACVQVMGDVHQLGEVSRSSMQSCAEGRTAAVAALAADDAAIGRKP